jgi:hypothetical protein
MSRLFAVLFLVAGVLVLMFNFVYGLIEFFFPLMLLFWFSIAFLGFAIRSSVQADANPGLEKVEKPDYWLSAVYEAWLYVTDREEWALYVCLWSYVFGVLIGSAVGGLVLFHWKTDFYTSLASWFSGMFMLLSIAGLIATSDHWSKATEFGETDYEEIKNLLELRVKTF